MITDEQILAIVRKHFTNNCSADIACARELIALARKPKKPKWAGSTYDVFFESPFGWYEVHNLAELWAFRFNRKLESSHTSMEDAIAAAEADYDKRCGECFE